MHIYELIEVIQNLTNTKFTQTELGVALNKTRGDINAKAKRKTELKLSEIRKIEEYIKQKYNLTIDLINTKQIQNIPANGVCEVPIIGNIRSKDFPGVKKHSNSNYTYNICEKSMSDLDINVENAFVLFAQGDSMMPTIIEGDTMLVDTGRTEIQDGKIYCVKMNKQFQAKRLQTVLPDRIKVISDNKDKYDAFYIDCGDFNKLEFSVVGEICLVGRLLK